MRLADGTRALGVGVHAVTDIQHFPRDPLYHASTVWKLEI
jgi:hypothetical protein